MCNLVMINYYFLGTFVILPSRLMPSYEIYHMLEHVAYEVVPSADNEGYCGKRNIIQYF